MTVSYTDPTSGDDIGAIQDDTGNDAASFSNLAVTNNSTVTPDNTPPVFGEGASASRSFAETEGGAVETGHDIGQPVAATDSDNDALDYSLTGAAAGKFDVDTSTGQISTKAGRRYSHESAESYSVTVGADDGTETVTISVTISVTDIPEPPLAPSVPAVTATPGNTTGLDVNWSAPSNTGRPDISGYDLRYREGTTGTFTDGPQDVTGTSAQLTGLALETAHQVQVRARNDEGAAGARVTVPLTPGPAAAVTIPLTRTDLGGATAADDYSGIPSSVTFQPGQTAATFTVTATDDTDDDDGESVRIGFGTLPDGVEATAPATAEVTLEDNDDGRAVTISFSHGGSVGAYEGNSTIVMIELDRARLDMLTLPLTAEHRGGASAADYSGWPSSVTFAPHETEKEFHVGITNDNYDDDGESAVLGFGQLPGGVSLGEHPTQTLTMSDDDGTRIWRVFFYESSYTATEGGAGARVSVRLSEPWKPWLNRALTVRLFTPELQGGASAADYSGWPSSVTFQPGQTEVTFTITATDDNDDDDGESILLQFAYGLPQDLRLGAHGATTVRLNDNDGSSAVRVSFGAKNYTAVEGGATATVRVRLSAAPGRSVTIPITRESESASDSDYSGVPQNVTFGSNETQKTFTVTATDDSVDDDHESVKLGFGPLPAAVFKGSPANATLTIEDNDGGGEMYAVRFDAASTRVRNLREGGNAYWTGVLLDRPAATELTIPLVVTHRGGATAADYTGLPATVTFELGESESGFRMRAVDDREDDPGEGFVVNFGTLAGVTVSTRRGSATFNIVDNDGLPHLSVADTGEREWPDPKSYLKFEVTLDHSATHEVRVDYTTVDGTAVAGQDYGAESGTLVFSPGDTAKTVRVGVEYDDHDEGIERMKLVLSNPLGAELADGEAEGRIHE